MSEESKQPFNEQAATLIKTSVELIEQVLLKHSRAILEEMHDQIVSRNNRIAELEKDIARRLKLIQLHHADAMELWKALNDLSFESDGVTCTQIPTRETYNRTLEIMQKHRMAYSEDGRSTAGSSQ